MIAARAAQLGGIGCLGMVLIAWPGAAATGSAVDPPPPPAARSSAAAQGDTEPVAPAPAADTRRLPRGAAANRPPSAPVGSLPDTTTVERETVALLERLLPPRTDTTGDWMAGSTCLHAPGDPRWLTPCIPGPPCDPSLPPHPFDLVGARGVATAGPIYRGPCAPRAGSHDCGPAPRLHRVHDALFDRFYRTK